MIKNTLTDLALYGGAPAFKEPLFVGRPNIGDRYHLSRRLKKILDSKWLTNNGPNVKEFEERISEIIGVRNCIAVTNATTGLEVALRALDLKGEVIIPAFTFVATAHALQWMGLKPVFCDVQIESHLIDPEGVERLITSATSAIIGVHLWGHVANVDALNDIAKRYSLKLLFDAAHAFGCKQGDIFVGSFGDLEVFSFHATKFVNSFEGGAIVTNNDSLAEKIRLMINFGFEDYDSVVMVGTNAKMDEFSAAMGLTSLDSLDLFVNKNYINYLHYKNCLSGIAGISLYSHDLLDGVTNYQYIVIEVDQSLSGISRDDLIKVLHSEGVIARRYFYPGCHKSEPYITLLAPATTCLPNTDLLSMKVVVLPTGTSISLEAIEVICSIIRVACRSLME